MRVSIETQPLIDRLMDTAVEQFQGGVSIFQEQLDALIASVSAERTILAESSEQLKRERQEYEEEKQRVSQVCFSFSLVSEARHALSTIASQEVQLNPGFLRQRQGRVERGRRQFHNHSNYTTKCTCSITLCCNVQRKTYFNGRPGK